MPKYYSLDLRQKVMQGCKEKQRKRETCETFKPAFEAFVKRTSFTQAKDLVPLFTQEFGYSVDYPVILRALKEMGWTFKKTFRYREASKIGRAVFQWILPYWKEKFGEA